MGESIKTNKRIYSFDFMRIIAACAVVMIHTSVDFVLPTQSTLVWGNLFHSLSRFAVPMFLMISGALMLDEDKEISVRKILKSSLNMFILLMLWSLFYAVGDNIIRPIVTNEPISLVTFFDTVFNGHYHLWYLFVLIGLYLITPILRLFIKRENSELIGKYLIFAVVICFVGSFVNQMVNIYTKQTDIVLNYISNFRLDCIFEYLLYYILGWYFVNVEISKKTRSFVYIGGLVGIIATIICGWFFFVEDAQANYFYTNNSLNVFLCSVGLFVFIHYLVKTKNIKANKFVLKLSNLTFGAYLIHGIFLFGVKLIGKKLTCVPLAICVIFAVTVVLSFVAAYIISKIPILKKLIRG